MRLQGLQALARILTLVAAAASAAIALVLAVADGQYGLAVAVVVALLLRLRARPERLRHAGAVGLLLAVAAIAGVLGGAQGLSLVLVLFVVADYGIERPPRTVAIVGVAAALVLATVHVVSTGAVAVVEQWLWSLALVPLVGLTAGQAAGRQSVASTVELESATEALDRVLALAERMPAGFDRWSVASAVDLELREVSRVMQREGPTTHLLLVQQGVLFGVGAPIARAAVGLLDDLPRQSPGRRWASVHSDRLPTPLAERLGPSRWYLHRLGGTGEHGVVLVPHDVHPSALDEVGEVLRPAAVALANVERFERLEDLALSSARTRVAHDLHDGVAQALTHVRFELDLLSLEHDELSDAVGAIRKVADAALLEVRRTVGELREVAILADRVEGHVQLLSSFSPASIELEIDHGLDVPSTMADDVFRIAQEALSNAVRHAGAERIRLTVTQDDRTLSVVVVDDGAGFSRTTRRGVGLDAMEQRAKRLGGTVTVRPRRGGGTVVELEAPITDEPLATTPDQMPPPVPSPPLDEVTR